VSAPAASVVVAVRDARATMGTCLDSVLALDAPPRGFEVIVVDNGSTDGTTEVVGRYADRVRLVTEPRKGVAAARNTGMEAAAGDVVAFTDADCIVTAPWLAALVRALDGRRDRVAGGRILATRPCNRVERFGERIHDHRAALEVYEPPYAIGMSWAMALPPRGERRVFAEDLPRGSDVDLSWRLHAAGHTFVYVDEAVSFHRNERTLRGLLAEGFTHERHGEVVRRRHGIAAARGLRVPRSLPDAVFRAGKALGRLSAAGR